MTGNDGVKYSSTRGSQSQRNLSFREVVMRGLAHDKGLFVPDTVPSVSVGELEEWRSLSFPDLAVEVLSKFVGENDVPRESLVDIVRRSCGAFREDDVTPVVEINGHYVLELFHGPTFAFKDVALQMLGNFFEYFLSTGSNDGKLTVLGATSGDTGSAAIYGLRGKKGVNCVILYPTGRVSPIQERQMTTVPDANVHCVSVAGTFDDCQDIVKSSFNDPAFRERVKLGAVNSINWCRVLAQTTYYFWSYFRVTDMNSELKEVHYSVPTGNFGDVLAGYYAKRMGLPVGRLIVATNENDILHRFFTEGKYHRRSINKTISPSMDICVSSNFERYLYHLTGDDPVKLKEWMDAFERTGELTLEEGSELMKKARTDFGSARADTSQTLDVIRRYNDDHEYLLCPHSAVGVAAVEVDTDEGREMKAATVCLATAHPAKFPDAVGDAVGQENLPPPPKQLGELFGMETRSDECPNEGDRVREYVIAKVEGGISVVKKDECVMCNNTKKALVMGAVVAAGAVVVAALTKSKKK